MSTIQTPIEDLSERRDLALEQAFLTATDSAITAPNTLQRALFPFLSSQDIGLLVKTGPAAGRLEAVFVPVMTGLRDSAQLQRLFLIAADDSLLDDYLYRLEPYLRALAIKRSQPFTFFVEGESALCRRYLPDSSIEDDVCAHPLDVHIDVVAATFTRFRSLFFGAGGVHAIPDSLEETIQNGAEFAVKRRDLFYFDEAHTYDRDELRGFITLLEFLYAADMDVLVGTSTLPEPLRDEFSFIESLDINEALFEPPRSIQFLPDSGGAYDDVACRLVKAHYFQSSRVSVIFETAEAADNCHKILSPLYPQAVFNYNSGQTTDGRLLTYARIRELEKEGEGYLLIADAVAISNADIDVNLMITGICAPESLIRRAGRCNRRGDLRQGQLVVVGDGGYVGRRLNAAKLSSYLEDLESLKQEKLYVPERWAQYAV